MASLGPASEQILSFQFQFIPWRSLCPEFQPQWRSPSIPHWAAQSNVALNAFCLVLSFTFILSLACQDKHTRPGTSGTQRSYLNGQSVPLGTHCCECHLSHQRTWMLIWMSARGSLWDMDKNHQNKLHHYGYVVVTWILHRFHVSKPPNTNCENFANDAFPHPLIPHPWRLKRFASLYFFRPDHVFLLTSFHLSCMSDPHSAPVSWNNQNPDWKGFQEAGLYRSFAK